MLELWLIDLRRCVHGKTKYQELYDRRESPPAFPPLERQAALEVTVEHHDEDYLYCYCYSEDTLSLEAILRVFIELAEVRKEDAQVSELEDAYAARIR